MTQGQIRQVGGGAGDGQSLDHAGHHAGDIAPGQHRPLRRAGGSGGVDHQADRIDRLGIEDAVDPGQPGLPGSLPICRPMLRPMLRPVWLLGQGGAGSLQVREGDDEGPVGLAIAGQALGLDDDAPQSRQRSSGLEQLVGLLLVFADDHLDIGMPDHIGHFTGGAGRVDADRHRADHAGAHLRQHPLDAVLRQHADMGTGFDPEARQTQADMAGPLVIGGPGGRLPDAEVLLAQGHPIGIAAGPGTQGLGQGHRHRQCHRLRHRLIHRLRSVRRVAHDSHRLRRL